MGFLGKPHKGKKKARKRKADPRQSRKAAFLSKLERLIADLTTLVEATSGNRKFTYQIRLQQALAVRDRVKKGPKPRQPGKTVYLVGPGSVRFVSGGAPGSKR
ncbi:MULTISPECIES: hypothetical protein [Mesorhizobium]|nr:MULTISPECIES: hypothetical protein [Mesorhizobium]